MAGLILANRLERGRCDDTPFVIEDICNGVKLKTIINKYNYPDVCFRKVKPLAAGMIYDIIKNICTAEHQYELLKKIINCYMPEQSMQQYRFATLLNSARNFSEQGLNNVEWIVKNTDYSKPFARLNNFLGDLEDYIYAQDKYNVRDFNTKMSLESAIEASRVWHERIAAQRPTSLYSKIPEDTEFSEPWIDAYSDDEFSIVPLKTAKDLIQESADMHHCVSSYARRVVDGQCYIYSVYRDKKKVATLELAKETPQIIIDSFRDVIIETQPAVKQKYKIAQLRGPCNAYVDDQVTNMVRSWISNANKKLSKEVVTV